MHSKITHRNSFTRRPFKQPEVRERGVAQSPERLVQPLLVAFPDDCSIKEEEISLLQRLFRDPEARPQETDVCALKFTTPGYPNLHERAPAGERKGKSASP